MREDQTLLFNLLAALERSARVTFKWIFDGDSVKTLSFNNCTEPLKYAGVTLFPSTLHLDNKTLMPVDTDTFCDNENNLYNFSYMLIKEITTCDKLYRGPNLDPFSMFKELAIDSGFSRNEELLIWFLDAYSSMYEKCELVDRNNLTVH